MRIKVKLGEKEKQKHRIKRLNLIFPNSLLKSRLAVKVIRDNLSRNEDGKTPIISPDYITHDLVKSLYKCLKTTIKQQGHFNLVEVDSSDGTKVLIRI